MMASCYVTSPWWCLTDSRPSRWAWCARYSGSIALMTGCPPTTSPWWPASRGRCARRSGSPSRPPSAWTGSPGGSSRGFLPAPASGGGASFPEALLDTMRATVARGGRVLSVCTGAFALGAAGLLDGRRCTTHWRHAKELSRRHPAAIVNPSVLYVDEDPVITSAGTAAGIDSCLHLVRKEQGTRVANGIARRMVVPPH